MINRTGRCYAVVALGFLSAGLSSTAEAASSYIDGVKILKVEHDISSLRGPNGRAWITIDQTFNPVGGCTWSGAMNTPAGWAFEFDVERGSFKSMFAIAIAAHMADSTVRIDFDDGFGSGTTCRIVNISLRR